MLMTVDAPGELLAAAALEAFVKLRKTTGPAHARTVVRQAVQGIFHGGNYHAHTSDSLGDVRPVEHNLRSDCWAMHKVRQQLRTDHEQLATSRIT